MNGENQAFCGEMLCFSSIDREKDLKAEFERVALPLLSQLHLSAVYLTKDSAEAEDLVQETFLLAFRFYHRFKPGTNIRNWLSAIQRNLFFSWYRQKRKEPEFVDWVQIDQTYDFLMEKENSPESFLISKSTAETIENALNGLPVEFRTAVLLVDVQDLEYQEAAQVLKCPVGTVRSRVSRGRRLLQISLRDYDL